eukprot:s4196_g2.t2
MSRGLLERVNVYFEDAGCKTDPTGLSKLASAGASVAVKAGAVASALVFGEILTPEDIFRLLSLEQDAHDSSGCSNNCDDVTSTLSLVGKGSLRKLAGCFATHPIIPGSLHIRCRCPETLKGDIFYDLGSGRGQVVLAAALSSKPKKCVGIELMEPRHQAALAAKAYAPEDIQRICEFRCEDALAGHLEDACKVYLCNAAFPRHLNAAFAAALDPQRAPALEALVTCAALPEESLHQARLQLTQVAECSATWATQGAPLFLYKRGGDGIRSAGGATAIPANVRYEASRQLSAATQSAGLSHEDERSLLRSAVLASKFALHLCLKVPMGRARQLYGQESSFGLWGPTLAVMVVAAFCLICWLTAAKPPDVQQSVRQIWEDSALGQNRDQRGCLQAAGFVWCEGAGKCIRPWKEACPGGTDFCRKYCAEQNKPGEASQRPRSGQHGSHSVFCRCTAGEADVEHSAIHDKRLEKRRLADVSLPRFCWQVESLYVGLAGIAAQDMSFCF